MKNHAGYYLNAIHNWASGQKEGGEVSALQTLGLEAVYGQRLLLLVSIGILLSAYFWNFMTLLFVEQSKHFVKLFIVLVLTGTFVHVVGIPATVAIPESMYSKSLPLVEMDMAQGVFRSVIALAVLVGSLIGGSLQFVSWLVFLFMLLMTGMSMLLSYKAYHVLKYPDEDFTDDEDDGEGDGDGEVKNKGDDK